MPILSLISLSSPKQLGMVSPELPVDWTDRVNAPLSAKEFGRVRVSIERGRPFGEDEWVKRTASELRLEHTIRPEGRPPKPRN